jgi:LSD1 subclass zinc finger protein
MEETKTQPGEENSEHSHKPVIHRVCEACNNMFANRPGQKSLRCPHCTKE